MDPNQRSNINQLLQTTMLYSEECYGCHEVIKEGDPEVRITVNNISKSWEGYNYFFCFLCGEQVKDGIMSAIISIHSVLYAEGKWPPREVKGGDGRNRTAV